MYVFVCEGEVQEIVRIAEANEKKKNKNMTFKTVDQVFDNEGIVWNLRNDDEIWTVRSRRNKIWNTYKLFINCDIE